MKIVRLERYGKMQMMDSAIMGTACVHTVPRPGMAVRWLRPARYGVAALMAIMCSGPLAWCAETDQFMVWGVELEDSSEAMNGYLNDEIEAFLDDVNGRNHHDYAPEELTRDLYLHFFRYFCVSRMKEWIQHSGKVDCYPDSSVSFRQYKRMSIFQDAALPYFVVAMSPTIRIGDVYCGVDKIAHFFGFGRRYHRRYIKLRAGGTPEEEAMEKVVLHGILQERTFFGRVAAGVFSNADLEANFQGLLLAKDLCGGESPYIIRERGQWCLARPVDLRDYITPGFDESYNCSAYWRPRKNNVLPVLRDEYAARYALPSVQARLAAYRDRPPSLSQRVIERYLARKSGYPKSLEFSDWVPAAGESVDSP